MKADKKINVLVVDDSLVFREVISRGISTDPGIEVVAKAVDPFDARDKIMKYNPDLMICDVEMPRMNGIEFLRRLLPQHSIPVIVVSSISHAVFDALHVGAVDFISKPNVQLPKSVEQFIEELIEKIKVASTAKIVSSLIKSKEPERISHISRDGSPISMIAIGASTGGTEAIFTLLQSFPKDIPGIVIVQHIPPLFSAMFAERLNQSCHLDVKEARSGDYIESGKVLIAPGDLQMRVKREGARYKVECFEGQRVNGHCPSVDVLFESIAVQAGSRAVGIILTGMGADGAKGLLAMRRRGARTFGQDEQSSVVYGMPKVAHETGAVEKQAGLTQLARLIYSVL